MEDLLSFARLALLTQALESASEVDASPELARSASGGSQCAFSFLRVGRRPLSLWQVLELRVTMAGDSLVDAKSAI